ncbi:MAG TPA: hypothetical protein VIY28_03535 [Pseudonocardiaceae bacterium]
MDALNRADQVLARAHARRAGVVTPDSATSPMDQASTVQIPRAMVVAADPRCAQPHPDDAVGGAASVHGDFGPAGPRR